MRETSSQAVRSEKPTKSWSRRVSSRNTERSRLMRSPVLTTVTVAMAAMMPTMSLRVTFIGGPGRCYRKMPGRSLSPRLSMFWMVRFTTRTFSSMAASSSSGSPVNERASPK